jgi:hypothetical protein
MGETAAKSAKQFLLNRLEEQALHDGVPLSDVEKKMFLFSEATASDKMLALAQEFDLTCDDADYEGKISELLQAAFRRDKASSEAVAAWKQSLEALCEEDFYGMVMVRQAGLPFSRRSVAGDIRLELAHFWIWRPWPASRWRSACPAFWLCLIRSSGV